MEREKQSTEAPKIVVNKIEDRSKEDYEKDISDIFEHKAEELKQDIKSEVKEDIQDILEHKVEEPREMPKPLAERPSETTTPTYEELEKPKVNIDVDSVVVNEKPKNSEDFFDDFFGSEGE